MAIIQCSRCGNDISDLAKICPKCGKINFNYKKRGIILLCLVAITILVICIFYVVISQNYKKYRNSRIKDTIEKLETSFATASYKEIEDYIDVLDSLDYDTSEYEKRLIEKKQNDILAQYNNAYDNFNFEEMEVCIKNLDALNYDTSDMKAVLEYDKKNYKIAKEYRDAISNLYSKCRSYSYSSLRSEVNKVKSQTDSIKNAEVNLKSRVGKYINKIQKHVLFNAFNSQYLYSNQFDLDYGLTSSSYAIIIGDYLEEILKEEL